MKTKQTILFTILLLFYGLIGTPKLWSQCYAFGNHVIPTTTLNPMFLNNYVLGHSFNNPTNQQITALALHGRGSGATVQMAIYSSLSNLPNLLLAVSEIGTVGLGIVTLKIPPLNLAPGDYFIMASYISSNSNTDHTYQDANGPLTNIFYTTHSLGQPMPASGVGFSSYSAKKITYWAVKENSRTEVVTHCGDYMTPYVWIDGNSYYTSNSTATFNKVNIGACDSIIKLDLTFINKPEILVHNLNNTLLTALPYDTYQWIDCSDNSSISGATAAHFTPTLTGQYALTATKNGCIDTSDCITFTYNVGLVNNENSDHFRVFPNPSSGPIQIQLESIKKSCLVSISDFSGRIVYTNNFSNTSQISLDVNISPGVYFLKVDDGQNRDVKKIIRY